MVVHHCVSLALFPVALLTHSHEYFVLQLLSTELTSALLHPAVFLMPKHGLKGTAVHTATGLSLLAAFMVWRMLPIIPLVVGIWRSREHLEEFSSQIYWAFVFAFPIPPLLNIYW